MPQGTTPSNLPLESLLPPTLAHKFEMHPFHGQVYKSLDGRTVLTLISKDECELSEGKTILLCKYTKPNDTLRIVTTALGTSQVIYYRFTNQGLQDNDGNVLFSPDGLFEAQRLAKLAQLFEQIKGDKQPFDPSMEDRVSKAEKCVAVLKPGFQSAKPPNSAEATMEQRVSAVERYLELAAPLKPTSIEERVFAIETVLDERISAMLGRAFNLRD